MSPRSYSTCAQVGIYTVVVGGGGGGGGGGGCCCCFYSWCWWCLYVDTFFIHIYAVCMSA